MPIIVDEEEETELNLTELPRAVYIGCALFASDKHYSCLQFDVSRRGKKGLELPRAVYIGYALFASDKHCYSLQFDASRRGKKGLELPRAVYIGHALFASDKHYSCCNSMRVDEGREG